MAHPDMLHLPRNATLASRSAFPCRFSTHFKFRTKAISPTSSRYPTNYIVADAQFIPGLNVRYPNGCLSLSKNSVQAVYYSPMRLYGEERLCQCIYSVRPDRVL